ncbi:hypothetical protein BDZ97DRAFT_45472 [Flammula alnicola]|nr:hypothetical protein BDZ97DRAFT_45472 [Flammula alnicola]
MSFTNINDPAGIAALLEQLKSSAAWQELTTAIATASGSSAHDPPAGSSNSEPRISTLSNVDEPAQTTDSTPNPSTIATIAGTSVASLLSQLSAEAADSFTPTDFSYGYANVQNASEIPPPPPLSFSHPAIPSASVTFAEEPTEDRRNFTFLQSLPVISELADTPTFADTIKKMKNDQQDLERHLWAEREAIYTKYQEKLKVAQNKAQMIGTVVSQHELNVRLVHISSTETDVIPFYQMVTDAFKKEIYRFDHERVIPAWDGLVSRQQNELAQIGVPTMFGTSDVQDREKQQQVISLLENIVGPKVP